MTSPGETPSARLTREQRIVGRLVQSLPGNPDKLKAIEARSQALPALLRRHGPVQVLLFLSARRSDENGGLRDRDLAGWLVEGVDAALGNTRALTSADLAKEAEALATMELAPYLRRWEIAIEVAGWLKMLIGARVEEAKQPPRPPAEAAAADGAAGGEASP